MDEKELQKAVNPIYLTAKGTLSLLYQAKDPDAVALMQHIGLETNLQERAKTIPDSISHCYKIAQQARYEINNTAALQSSAPNIVDLPSGYSPRGFRVSSAGKRYFGFDLPVVIDDMAPVLSVHFHPHQGRILRTMKATTIVVGMEIYSWRKISIFASLNRN